MEALEEGQISQDQDDRYIPGPGYNPLYEWPGEETYSDSSLDPPEPSSSSSRPLRPGQPVFRLVVLRSSILSAKKKVVVIDTYSEVQLGRDVQPEGSATPRIRLKEMEVSKIHATVFWDGARKEWNAVDMGSKHGTFLLPGPVSPDSDGAGTRLSQPRTASIPRRLRHSDQLTLGSTTFEVHIHDNQRPCRGCAVTGHEEIPLFPLPRTAVKRTRDVAGIDPDFSESPGAVSTDRDPKKALTMLKRSLLTRHDDLGHSSAPTAPVWGSNGYVDRAARRRLLHPGSRPDTPGVPSTLPTVTRGTGSPQPAPEEVVTKPVASQPPVPLPASNVGHRLLIQQGWAPGNALGLPPDPLEGRIGLVDPLEIKSSQNRAGLGMKQPVPLNSESSFPGLNWKEKEKFKRFGELRR
ncbi:hypothetical protein GALMADRAFT_121275 [Galerina marginata CBS 339.88]|uniref:G-patch domain-containing protein n=1 Tax=Galerina marginata (strain CBS 339.88) TaxID=685588 RepID=A0A067TBD3_GALM3|nr:hypothetical protein GALMADRAFT_121275 [Galerina marginata CBS 339.88]